MTGAEVDWIPGLVALAGGSVLGLVLGVMSRRGPTGQADAQHSGRSKAEARAIRIEDLSQRKDQLIQQIRDLEDTDLAEGIDYATEERAALEQEAAKVLRELHHLEGKQSEATPARASVPPGEANADSAPTRGGMSPELKGALTGGAVVGFAALLLFSLQTGTAERTGNMPMTGGDLPTQSAEGVRDVPPPGSGRPGEAVPGVPPSLQPKPSPRVDAARSAVAANPSAVPPRVELGWALVDAEGWIDVFNNAEQLLKIDPANADALAQQAVVRIRMGQRAQAESLLDQALASTPSHGRALAWKGSLRWQAGDVEAAKAVWQKGFDLYPNEGFGELLKMAKGEIAPGQIGAPGAGSATAAQAAQGETSQPRVAVGETSQPGATAAAKPPPVTGTVLVPDGANIPPGAVIFVYARPAGQTAGPPLAAVKLPATGASVPFSIGPDNMPPMMGKRPFPESVSLAARLDYDGNAGTKDGLSGSVPEPVAAGTSGVTISLSM